MLEQGYWIMPNIVLYDKNLNDKQKLLFVSISSLCAEKGYCWANNEYFAKLFWVDKITISRNITKLQKEWFIKIEIDIKQGNKRKILLTKTLRPINKNVKTSIQKSIDPINKNVKHNNINNNNINFENEKLTNTLNDFYDYRKEKKKPLTEKAKSLLINKIKKWQLDYSDNQIIWFLEKSIMNGWTWVFEDKNIEKEKAESGVYKDWLEWWKLEKEKFAEKYWGEKTFELMNLSQAQIKKMI